MAFWGLFNHAQRNLSKQLDRLDPNDEREWKTRQDIEQSFMNVIVAGGSAMKLNHFYQHKSRNTQIMVQAITSSSAAT